jgi:hypothetical protein
MYAALVALPAARSNAGFAVYYTAAYLLAREPWELPNVYNDAWFVAKLNHVALPGVYDIMFYNPPTVSLMLLPLAWLPPEAARAAWALLGLPLLAGGLVFLARALTLPALWGVWALPFALLYAPITENIRAGQAYLLLFFLLCAAFWALERPDEGRRTMDDARQQTTIYRLSSIVRVQKAGAVAGLALGLMLILKAAGFWLWPLLLAARRWRAVAWACGAAAALALLTLPRIGGATWRAYLELLPGAAGDPKRTVTAYQTVTGLFGHLLDYDARWNPAPLADAPWAPHALTLVVALGALALTARWVSARHPPALLRQARGEAFLTRGEGEHESPPLPRLGEGGRGVREPLALALCMALLVTNAPFAEGYHYTLALPSLLVAAWWAWRARLGWGAWAVLGAAALLLGAPLPYKSARLQSGWPALLAYPRVYGAYLLWGWLAWALKGLATFPEDCCSAENR